jgi:hypothetical protein
MRAVKKARKFILAHPEHPTSDVLTQLILSLETESDFPLQKLYQLSLNDFELAIEVLQEWRLDRYYEGKSKLIDAALQVRELPSAARSS